MPQQLQFVFSGSIVIDEVSRSDMEEEGFDVSSAADVAEYFGGRQELLQFCDVVEYSLS